MARTRSRQDPDTVQAVSRALAILEALAKANSPISLTDLARGVDLKLTTVHRLLSTLMQRGFAEQEPVTMRYRLGIKAFEVGNAAFFALDIRAIARPFLQKLEERLNETVNLAILDKGEVVYIDQVESTNIVIVKMFARIGSRGPAHCTGTGKVLLAGLPDEELLPLVRRMQLARFTEQTLTTAEALLAEIETIRQKGYGLDRGEREEGVLCVAAPIRNHEGRVAAAISVSGPTTRLEEGQIVARFVPVVREIAGEISTRLGYVAHPSHYNAVDKPREPWDRD